jgi:hypothetical protein
MPKLILHCEQDLSYTLTDESQEWKRAFFTLSRALDYAQSIITQETHLLVYTERGRAIESLLTPQNLLPDLAPHGNN